MKISLGASVELENARWWRADFELDETDFLRLCYTHGIDAEPARIPVSSVFQVLESEGQRLLIADLMIRFPTQKTEENQRSMVQYTAQRDKAIERIKEATSGS